ncbi:CopD family protein [Halostella sp. PRR32]|uniref:CopD family protein n=1 Tax=Halostella sp. PRR32 TaxID=3098147 RepID=UPI002B1DBC29|nr:CopD family protein [Halostella sp. PRR32]
MSLVDAAIRTTHLLFAALWVGSVLFVTLAVLPAARDGHFNADPLERLVGSLKTISRVSAVLLFVTGGHMAAQGYPGKSLLETTNGNLVLAMLALWLVLAGLIEVGSSKLTADLKMKKVRAPARENIGLFRAAAVVGVLLLVDAGLITSGALL